MSPKKTTKRPSGNTHHVRIIAGQWRGRKLPVIDADGLRPTGDRIRETLFNWLAPHIEGARCLDLFAGSGALGFEALSRGAASCDFVELNGAVAKTLEANKQLLNAQGAEIHRKDWKAFLESEAGQRPWDVVFLDPPFSEGLHDQIEAFILENRSNFSETCLIYREAPARQPASKLVIEKSKSSGNVSYQLVSLAN